MTLKRWLAGVFQLIAEWLRRGVELLTYASEQLSGEQAAPPAAITPPGPPSPGSTPPAHWLEIARTQGPPADWLAKVRAAGYEPSLPRASVALGAALPPHPPRPAARQNFSQGVARRRSGRRRLRFILFHRAGAAADGSAKSAGPTHASTHSGAAEQPPEGLEISSRAPGPDAAPPVSRGDSPDQPRRRAPLPAAPFAGPQRDIPPAPGDGLSGSLIQPPGAGTPLPIFTARPIPAVSVQTTAGGQGPAQSRLPHPTLPPRASNGDARRDDGAGADLFTEPGTQRSAKPDATGGQSAPAMTERRFPWSLFGDAGLSAQQHQAGHPAGDFESGATSSPGRAASMAQPSWPALPGDEADAAAGRGSADAASGMSAAYWPSLPVDDEPASDAAATSPGAVMRSLQRRRRLDAEQRGAAWSG